jgi:hypothetical protein
LWLFSHSWSENESNGEPLSPIVPPSVHVGLDGFSDTTLLADLAVVLLAEVVIVECCDGDGDDAGALVCGAAIVIVVDGSSVPIVPAAVLGSVAAAGTSADVSGVAATGGSTVAAVVVCGGNTVVVFTTTLHSRWMPWPATKLPSSDCEFTLLPCPAAHANATSELSCSSPKRQACEQAGAGSKSETVQAGMLAVKTAAQAEERLPAEVESKLERERAEALPRRWRRWAREGRWVECIAAARLPGWVGGEVCGSCCSPRC